MNFCVLESKLYKRILRA